MKAKNNIDLVDQLEAYLLELPSLVDKLEQKHFQLIEIYFNWLKNVESCLKQYNRAETAQISGIRSKILASKFENKKQKRINIIQVAATTINDAQQIIQNIIEPSKIKLEESSQILLQLLILARREQLLAAFNGKDFTTYIIQIWRMLQTNPKLNGGIERVTTLISKPEAMRLLGDLITNKDIFDFTMDGGNDKKIESDII